MTRAEVAEVMDHIFGEMHFLREQGQKEYAHDEDNAFANFERVAEHLGVSREKVLMVYALKHLDGIVAYINGHKSQREDVRGRIGDLMVYLVLLRAMIEDGQRSEFSKSLEAIGQTDVGALAHPTDLPYKGGYSGPAMVGGPR